MSNEATAAALQDLRELVGTVLETRYRIDELLGEGGMGLVFRAHHLLLKRDVAIKVLHPELSANPQLSARFDREAQSAARLEHPNIVHVSEFGSTAQGMKYMVMQLLEGCELEQLVGHGLPLDPTRCVDLAIQIFRGLEHAHKHGVVHRDLKPENIFATKDHEEREILKIVDFGIAKIVAEQDEEDTARPLTRHGLVFGTPEYMSPEQATGVEVDHRSDLYSAGVILYEMLAGVRPFMNDDKVALIRMQVASDPPPFDRDLPEGLGHLVFELLSKDRAERPQSAAEVVSRLELIRADLGEGVPQKILPAHTRPPSGGATTAVAIPAPITQANTTLSAPTSGGSWTGPALAAVLTGLALTAGIVYWTQSDEDTTTAQVNPAEDEADTGASRRMIDEGTFANIDREILAKHGDQALELIKPLRDKYPEDPQLLWREGQALALARGNKSDKALAAFGEAMDRDAKLLEDPHFVAELYDLLRNRKLREQALDIALQKMGSHGHKFLLELVNERNPARALEYADRHRALDALMAAPDAAPLIDRRINLARDLWQSYRGRSPSPCVDFRQAIRDIDAVADPYFTPGVQRAKIPEPRKDEPETACDGAEAELEALRIKLESMQAPDDAGNSDGEG